MEMLSLLDRLESADLEPVYLLHGPERFFIDQVIAAIKKIVSKQPMADLNCDRYKADELSGAEIVAKAREVPMLSRKRLVVIEDGHKLRAEDLEALDPYFAEPVAETCLVIAGEKFDLRRGPFLRAGKRKQVYKSEALKEAEIGPFVRARAKVRGVSMTEQAVFALAAAIGPDCAALDDAVERIGLYAGLDRAATEEDVFLVVTPVREHSVFELVDALGNRAADRALALLEALVANREEPIMINAMMARHVRQLLKARIYVHMGTPSQELPGLLGAPPFAVRKITEQARRFRGAVLERFLLRLARADFELKSSRRPPRAVLEGAILDLCLESPG